MLAQPAGACDDEPGTGRGDVTMLVVCMSCSRHRRAADDRCPFCGVEAITVQTSEAAQPLPPGLTRAAFVLMGASAIAACGKSPKEADPPPPPAPTEQAVPAYGPAPTLNPPVPVPTQQMAPAYGPPPMQERVGKPDAGKK